MKGNEKGQALYRKYRSRSLDEVVGQSHVTEVLRRGLKQGRVAHAYLLTGPKGTGKTSIARILAHEINQLPYNNETTHLDIIEIDAASNNGVDDVRDLRDKVQLAPIAAAKKIYIIDEVHMLSKAAFNALLKTLEEPPEHVVFILATTDLHKVPATIISRTQHFAFRSISLDDLKSQLRKIAEAEGMTVSDEALAAIAERGDGSFRNSISLLDQMSSFADDKDGITLDLVETTLGLAGHSAIEQLLQAVDDRDVASVATQLNALEQSGIQPVILTDQIIHVLKNKLADDPNKVTLLDSLLSVTSSPQPGLKLLAVLVSAIKPKATTVAAAVATRPKMIVQKPVQQPGAKSVPAPTSMPVTETKEAVADGAVEVEAEPPQTPRPRRNPDEPIILNWDALIEEARKNHVALHSVLSKCTHKLDGDTLTLFTGRKFNKTKLDDPKYLTKLHEVLATQGIEGLLITTVPTPEPPADEKLAAIAAMMGGGQEITLDE